MMNEGTPRTRARPSSNTGRTRGTCCPGKILRRPAVSKVAHALGHRVCRHRWSQTAYLKPREKHVVLLADRSRGEDVLPFDHLSMAPLAVEKLRAEEQLTVPVTNLQGCKKGQHVSEYEKITYAYYAT